MKFQRLALIGCGLMGGSFALALRQAGLVTQVAGFSASEATRQKALKLGVIDSACASAAPAAANALAQRCRRRPAPVPSGPGCRRRSPCWTTTH